MRAHGGAGRPGAPAEYAAYAHATAGRQFGATLEWEAYDSERGVTALSKWAEFPDNPEKPGEKLAYVELPGGKRLWARARIRRYVDVIGG